MLPSRTPVLILLACLGGLVSSAVAAAADLEPLGPGPYAVGSTNLEVAPEYADIGDEAMHEILLGRADDPERPRYVSDILRHPDSAWVIDVPIPDQAAVYGPASGRTLPVVAFLAYPSVRRERPNRYAFPYHDSRYGVFEDMLGAGESPRFADPGARYPLIVYAHGAPAHGVYDIGHAQSLASHGFIVAVIFYGDDRTAADDPNHHVSFLRPMLTKAVIDSIVDDEAFGPHVDAEQVGISGHSFGGFTALTLAGGPYLGKPATVRDRRVKAAVLTAPWVGGNYDGEDFHAFGPENRELERVTTPVLCLFGTRDEVTRASFVLPAMRRLSGPTHVVELVDQPHIFEQGSWEDRDHWELLFFSAYLKNDPDALAALRSGRSMKGGNADRQLFDYQRPDPEAALAD